MKRTLRFDFGEATIREVGIVHARTVHNAEINLEQAKAYLEIIDLLTENTPHVTIVDISSIKHISKEARAFISTSTSNSGNTVALAFISNSFAARTIASFFLTVNRPTYPVKIFKDSLTAHQWAKNEYCRFSTRMAS